MLKLTHLVYVSAIYTVMCYNVLCDKYATRQLYGYCPSWALNWEYRKKAIMEEIRQYNADILSLQVCGTSLWGLGKENDVEVDVKKSIGIIGVCYGCNASVPLGFFSVADALTMEIDKHQAMFGRYNRTFGE